MKITTSRFGEIDIDSQSIISFPGGLIGFPDEEQYVIIRHNPESPFYWLQATEKPDLAFVLVDPVVFKPDYEFHIPKLIFEHLEVDSSEDLGTYVIVTVPPGKPEEMTANLLGPILINTKSKLARQIVLDENLFSHRHPMLQEGAQ